MAKNALVIVADGFEEAEAVVPIDFLRRAGVRVTVAGLAGAEAKGSRGLIIKTDMKLADAGSAFDACVLPGGGAGAENLAASSAVGALVKRLAAEGKVVAAICASPAVVLAPLGVLKGRSATCYPGMETGFGKETKHAPGDVVVDGNIVTSRGPGTSFAFACAVARLLVGEETVAKVRAAMLIS